MKPLFFVALAVCSILVSGCSRQPGEVWDDTKSCGRHLTRGLSTLCGQYSASRQVNSKGEFIGWQENTVCSTGYQEEEFIPFPVEDNCNEIAMNDQPIPQPQETPGDPGSSIPGINAFRDPATMAQLRSIFRQVFFDYDSNRIKGSENMATIESVANYLRSHPNTYIFVEGHCDERGPEAYNLALGARRSNAVRSVLIEKGVNPDNVFTISYGAERPLIMESHEEAWSQNRRAEFKIYQP